MYCNQCGKQVPDGAKFCHHCGSVVGLGVSQEVHQEVQSEPMEQIEKPEKQVEPFEENAGKKGNKKKLITIAIIAVAVISVIAGIVAVVTSQKTVAELPDPEYYFPVVAEVQEERDFKRVIVRSDEYPWDQVAGYVNLLKYDGIYSFTSYYEESHNTGYEWRFRYNNLEEIKKPSDNQIQICYYRKGAISDQYEIWVSICDTDAFDLVQDEKYVETTNSDTGSYGEDSSYSVDSGDDSNATNFEQDTTSESYDSDIESYESDGDDSYEVPDSSDLYDNPTPCGVCNGDGDCKTCSGDGYLMSSASDEEDRNCYSCSGSGNCRSCGGDGKL